LLDKELVLNHLFHKSKANPEVYGILCIPDIFRITHDPKILSEEARLKQEF